MDANEKNLSVAMNLLEGILAKSRIERDATKNYLIYFPVFDDENGKILAKFPIFERDGMEATLKGWQVYNLDDYKLDAFLLDNQNIVFDDYNTINYRNPEDVEKLLYFINIFLKVQEFKKTGRGIDVVPENKTIVEDLIGDFENNIVDNISEDVNRIYNYEIEYEDDVEADPSILDSIDSLDDYEDTSVTPVVEETEEVIEEDEEETVLPGMSFEDDDITVEEETPIAGTLETEDVVEDEPVLPGMNFEDDEDEFPAITGFEDETGLENNTTFETTDLSNLGSGLDEFTGFEDNTSTLEDEEESVLPGMNFDDEEDDEFLVNNTEDEIIEEETILPGMSFEEDEELEEDTLVEDTTSTLEEPSLDLGFEFEEESLEDDGLLLEDEETEEDTLVEDTTTTALEEPSLDLGLEFEEESLEDDGLLEDEETEEDISVEDEIIEDEIIEEEVIDDTTIEDEEVVEEIEEVEEDEFEDLEGFDKDEDDDFDDIPTIDDLEALADQELAADTEPFDLTSVEVTESLDVVVGMESVKAKIEEYQRYVEYVNSMNLATANLNLAFVGNKGTGKSIIADVVTEILFESGLISEGKLIKVNKKELCGGHHHKSLVVDNIIDTAMGGILLIDEACRCDAELCPEVSAKLVEAMDAGLVVIFSGCNEGMGEFLSLNREIAAKVSFVIEFPDYSAEELKEITKFKLEFEGFDIDEEADKAILDLITTFEGADVFNSKLTSKLFQKIILKHSVNSNSTNIVKEDIPTVYEMLDYTNCDDRKVVAETVKAVFNSNVKLIVAKEDKIAVLKTKESAEETKSALMNKVTGLLVGMAAEEVYFGEYSYNSHDLKVATHIVKHMVKNGMSDFGFARMHKCEPEMTKVVYDETNRILAKCFADAKAYVTKNKNNLDNVVEYVRKNNEIDAEAIFKQFENKKEVKETKAPKAVKEEKVVKTAKVTKTKEVKKETKKEPVKKATAKKEPAVKKPTKEELAEKAAKKQELAKKTTAKSAVRKAKK